MRAFITLYFEIITATLSLVFLIIIMVQWAYFESIINNT
jgi:hypothetical protein